MSAPTLPPTPAEPAPPSLPSSSGSVSAPAPAPAPASASASALSPEPARQMWRGLEELEGSRAFVETWLHREFPPGAAEWTEQSGLDRRRFLQLVGASLALAGATGCRMPRKGVLVPYVRQPEDVQPGVPQWFATGLDAGGYVKGVTVQSREGRPVKIEGNPAHPASQGRTDIFMQADLLRLYDPDRGQTPLNGGRIAPWEEFYVALSEEEPRWRDNRGAGLRLLTGQVTSPTIREQIARLLERFPAARWHEYEPGQPAPAPGAGLPLYDFARASVILSLDADFLSSLHPHNPASARGFAAGRRVAGVDDGPPRLNRLYAVESVPTQTGAMSDHRLSLPPAAVAEFALALAAALGVEGVEAPTRSGPPRPDVAPWLEAVVADLRAAGPGQSVVVASEFQPAALQQLVRAVNERLGNVGQSVVYRQARFSGSPGARGSLAELARDLDAGRVDAIFLLGEGNPVYSAPADLDFGAKLAKARWRVRHGLYYDETAAACAWYLPDCHPLETWSDGYAYDGTVSINQPLVNPLYDGRSPLELFSVMLGAPMSAPGYEVVRDHWRRAHPGPDEEFERFWRRSLHEGVLAAGASVEPPFEPAPARPLAAGFGPMHPATPAIDAPNLELILRPDPNVADGRWTNNAWLQELPRPVSKLTWDNAASVGPALAARLGLKTGDVVELRYQGRTLRAPAWIQPGQADGCVLLTLGYGRTRAGRVGNGVGVNAYRLQTAAAPWGGPGLELAKTKDFYPLVSTQQHNALEGTHLVRAATVERFRQQPDFAPREVTAPALGDSLYPEVKYGPARWGMAIDLSTCIGCMTCTIACQAENNIPTVGKEQVALGRWMHWIRVDRYYEGEPENPAVYHQPVPCMHCENAPCELVCPVAATLHDDEGINNMVYNRCVGTRYCANNCPYKVRRFNFLTYNDEHTPTLKMLRNPSVTVRSRGVMEKCTYCIQRIKDTEAAADRENRPLRDGEILTACQQACPTDAIIFGDLADPASRVARLRAHPLSYGMLAELNTRPRTTYLAKITNPNPRLAPAAPPTPVGAEH